MLWVLDFACCNFQRVKDKPLTNPRLLFVDCCVGINLLHVVKIFQRIEQFLHFRGVFAREFDFSLRFHDHFGDLSLEAGSFQRVL